VARPPRLWRGPALARPRRPRPPRRTPMRGPRPPGALPRPYPALARSPCPRRSVLAPPGEPPALTPVPCARPPRPGLAPFQPRRARPARGPCPRRGVLALPGEPSAPASRPAPAQRGPGPARLRLTRPWCPCVARRVRSSALACTRPVRDASARPCAYVLAWSARCFGTARRALGALVYPPPPPVYPCVVIALSLLINGRSIWKLVTLVISCS
jgi:hypothetical protein